MIYKKLKKANKIRSYLLTFCNNEILNILKQKNPMLINTYSPINLFNTNSSNYEEIKIENEIQKGNYNIFDNQKFENILSRSKTADEKKIEEELNKVNDVIIYISKIKDKKIFVSQKKLNKVFFHDTNNIINNELKPEKKENLFKKKEKPEEKKIKFYALKLQNYADKFINYKEKKKKKKIIKNLDNSYDNKIMKEIKSNINLNTKLQKNLELYKNDSDYDFKICLVSMKKKKSYRMKINTEINNFNNTNNKNQTNSTHNHHANSKKKVQFDIGKSNIYYTKTDTNINRIRKIKSYTQLSKYINIDSEND